MHDGRAWAGSGAAEREGGPLECAAAAAQRAKRARRARRAHIRGQTAQGHLDARATSLTNCMLRVAWSCKQTRPSLHLRVSRLQAARASNSWKCGLGQLVAEMKCRSWVSSRCSNAKSWPSKGAVQWRLQIDFKRCKTLKLLLLGPASKFEQTQQWLVGSCLGQSGLKLL